MERGTQVNECDILQVKFSEVLTGVDLSSPDQVAKQLSERLRIRTEVFSTTENKAGKYPPSESDAYIVMLHENARKSLIKIHPDHWIKASHWYSLPEEERVEFSEQSGVVGLDKVEKIPDLEADMSRWILYYPYTKGIVLSDCSFDAEESAIRCRESLLKCVERLFMAGAYVTSTDPTNFIYDPNSEITTIIDWDSIYPVFGSSVEARKGAFKLRGAPATNEMFDKLMKERG
jgi:hypothetical protein